jgi:hypothetical protein
MACAIITITRRLRATSTTWNYAPVTRIPAADEGTQGAAGRVPSRHEYR